MTDTLAAASIPPVSASIGNLTSLKPYPGLRSFTQDEALLFFGREVQVRQIRDILANRNLLVVLGGSGSGKSSLVRAGLLPKLNSTAPIPKRSGAWYAVEFRPLTNPIAELFEAIFVQIFQPLLNTPSSVAGTGTEGQPTQTGLEENRRLAAVSAALDIDPALQPSEDIEKRCRERLRERLFKGRTIDIGSLFAFAEQTIVVLDEKLAAGPRSGKANLLILIDQFEEVFSLPAENREDGQSMVMSLVTGIQAFRPDNLFLIVTMRNEWLHRCSEIPGVAEAMNGSTYLVDLLNDSEIRNIIVEPARSVLRAARLDPGPSSRGPYSLDVLRLLQQAFDDTAAVPDASDRLPLLPHLLQLLWDSADPTRPHFSIETRHLEAIPGWEEKAGWKLKGLPGCLNARAGQVLKAAVEAASQSSPLLGKDGAEKLIRSAFVSLAILDEKGIVRRNLVTIDEILDSSGLVERATRSNRTETRYVLAGWRIDATTVEKPDSAEESERAARNLAEIRNALIGMLAQFKAASLVGSKQTAKGELFDINHEALVRNWDTCASWISQAKLVKDRLRAIDEKIRQTNVAQKGWLARFTNLLFATDLSSAHEQVGSETAKALRDDVFGDQATFSKSWARHVLGNDNVAQIGHRVADAQRFVDNPLHRYRPLAVFIAALALAGLLTIVTRQLFIRDMEQFVNLQSIVRRTDLSQGTVTPAGPPETYATFKIAFGKLNRVLTPDVMRRPLADMLVGLEGNWRSHFGRSIWLKSSAAQHPTSMSLHGSVESKKAICITPRPERKLQIRKDERTQKNELEWGAVQIGSKTDSGSVQAAQKTVWRPTTPAIDKEPTVKSNLYGGEEWPDGSVVCTSPDGRWQLKWINDKPTPKWPSIRYTLVNKLTPPQGEPGFYVEVGSERYFTDEQTSGAYGRELQSSLPTVSDSVSNPGNTNTKAIQFVRDGHWVGFSIPVEGGKAVTLWTTEGIAEPQETYAPPSSSKPCARKNGDLLRCTIGSLTYGENVYDVRVTSFPPSQDSPDCFSAGSTCATFIDLLFVDQSTDKVGQPADKKVRAVDPQDDIISARLSFPKRQIKSGTITAEGYLVLTDIANQTWRYLIDGNKLAELQKDTWRESNLENAAWSAPCRKLQCDDMIRR